MSKQSAIKKRQQLMKDIVFQVSFQLKVHSAGGLEEDSLFADRGSRRQGAAAPAMAAVSAAGFTSQPLPPAPPQNKSAMTLYKALRRTEKAEREFDIYQVRGRRETCAAIAS